MELSGQVAYGSGTLISKPLMDPCVVDAPQSIEAANINAITNAASNSRGSDLSSFARYKPYTIPNSRPKPPSLVSITVPKSWRPLQLSRFIPMSDSTKHSDSSRKYPPPQVFITVDVNVHRLPYLVDTAAHRLQSLTSGDNGNPPPGQAAPSSPLAPLEYTSQQSFSDPSNLNQQSMHSDSMRTTRSPSPDKAISKWHSPFYQKLDPEHAIFSLPAQLHVHQNENQSIANNLQPSVFPDSAQSHATYSNDSQNPEHNSVSTQVYPLPSNRIDCVRLNLNKIQDSLVELDERSSFQIALVLGSMSRMGFVWS